MPSNSNQGYSYKSSGTNSSVSLFRHVRALRPPVFPMPANCFAIGLLSLRHPELYTVMLTIRDVTCRATTTAPVTTAAAPATATAITTLTREFSSNPSAGHCILASFRMYTSMFQHNMLTERLRWIKVMAPTTTPTPTVVPTTTTARAALPTPALPAASTSPVTVASRLPNPC